MAMNETFEHEHSFDFSPTERQKKKIGDMHFKFQSKYKLSKMQYEGKDCCSSLSSFICEKRVF